MYERGTGLMATRVAPFLRLAILCHQLRGGQDEPFSLIEPLHTVQLPTDRFGHPLSELFLYTQIEDAVGMFEFSVRVVDEMGTTIPQPHIQTVTRTFDGGSDNRIIPFELPFRLVGV